MYRIIKTTTRIYADIGVKIVGNLPYNCPEKGAAT